MGACSVLQCGQPQRPVCSPHCYPPPLALLLVLWLQSHLECRLWNEIFVDAQKDLGIPNGALGIVGRGRFWKNMRAQGVCKLHDYCRSI